jgi:hypothetical protein
MAQEQAGQSAPAPLNTAFLRGKITAQRYYDTREGARIHVSVLRLAGADEYGSGGSVEVEAQQPLGAIGAVLSVKAKIGGNLRPFTWTDRETGERKRGTEARVRFTALLA